MKTIEKSFISVLSVSLIVLCLACEHKSQIEAPDSKTTQKPSSVPKEDLSNWQTVLLREKGIMFKLPPDWHRDESDLESKNQDFIIEALEWNTPNREMIRIFITTYPKGFISLKRTVASKEEMLEEKFNSVAQIKESDPLYSEVKKLKLSGVEGVSRVLQIDFKDEDLGVRRGINWTGYRVYQGNGQEIDINISANQKSEDLLRTIFNTLEIEQDKDANPKR